MPLSFQNHLIGNADNENRCQSCQSIRGCACAFERTLRERAGVDMYDILAGLRLSACLGFGWRYGLILWGNGMRVGIVMNAVACLLDGCF